MRPLAALSLWLLFAVVGAAASEGRGSEQRARVLVLTAESGEPLAGCAVGLEGAEGRSLTVEDGSRLIGGDP